MELGKIPKFKPTDPELSQHTEPNFYIRGNMHLIQESSGDLCNSIYVEFLQLKPFRENLEI